MNKEKIFEFFSFNFSLLFLVIKPRAIPKTASTFNFSLLFHPPLISIMYLIVKLTFNFSLLFQLDSDESKKIAMLIFQFFSIVSHLPQGSSFHPVPQAP